jgi:hypothetical protein
MSDTHHCPFCELIFISLPELQGHIELDHPDRHVPDRGHHEYHGHPDRKPSEQDNPGSEHPR